MGLSSLSVSVCFANLNPKRNFCKLISRTYLRNDKLECVHLGVLFFMVISVCAVLAFASCPARRAVLTFMHPSVTQIHSHVGVRQDLAVSVELLAFFPQQSQIRLFRIVPYGYPMFLHVET